MSSKKPENAKEALKVETMSKFSSKNWADAQDKQGRK